MTIRYRSLPGQGPFVDEAATVRERDRLDAQRAQNYADQIHALDAEIETRRAAHEALQAQVNRLRDEMTASEAAYNAAFLELVTTAHAGEPVTAEAAARACELQMIAAAHAKALELGKAELAQHKENLDRAIADRGGMGNA